MTDLLGLYTILNWESKGPIKTPGQSIWDLIIFNWESKEFIKTHDKPFGALSDLIGNQRNLSKLMTTALGPYQCKLGIKITYQNS